MKSPFSFRKLTPQDSQAFGKLMDTSPDTGRFSNAAHFEIDAFEALRAMQSDFVGVVAETPTHAGIVGACLARFGQAQFEDGLRPYDLAHGMGRQKEPSFEDSQFAILDAGWKNCGCYRQLGSNRRTPYDLL